MLGIMLGMQLMLLLVAFGIGGLILIYPALHLLLKIAGSLYLLWLSWKIGSAPYEVLEVDLSPDRGKPCHSGREVCCS